MYQLALFTELMNSLRNRKCEHRRPTETTTGLDKLSEIFVVGLVLKNLSSFFEEIKVMNLVLCHQPFVVYTLISCKKKTALQRCESL